MYKIKITLLIMLGFFILGINNSFSDCKYDPNVDLSIKGAIESCLSDTDLVNPGDVDVSGSHFKDLVLGWIKSISIFLSAGAVFAIVYGALLMTLSGGEEDKIKKGKDAVKWGLLGFLGVVFASALISVVISFIYSLSG